VSSLSAFVRISVLEFTARAERVRLALQQTARKGRTGEQRAHEVQSGRADERNEISLRRKASASVGRADTEDELRTLLYGFSTIRKAVMRPLSAGRMHACMVRIARDFKSRPSLQAGEKLSAESL